MKKISSSEGVIHGPPTVTQLLWAEIGPERETLQTKLCDCPVDVQPRFRPQSIDTIENYGVIKICEGRLTF